MKILIKNLFIIWILTAQYAVHAEEIQPVFMPENQHKEIVYVDKKTGAERARWTISLRKTSRGQAAVYQISSTGKGDYDIYEDVAWEAGSEMEERKGLLYPLYSLIVIKDSGDRVIVKREKRFEYEEKKIFYSASDSEGNIIDEAVFPIKGLTADSVTITYILKVFAARRDDKAYKELYLLSEKKRLYRVTVKPMEKEILDLPSGKVEAIKLRLIPNLGPLTGIIGSLIPPTFVWYIDRPPYEWLQYEGLETGIGSTHIKAYVSTMPFPETKQ